MVELKEIFYEVRNSVNRKMASCVCHLCGKDFNTRYDYLNKAKSCGCLRAIKVRELGFKNKTHGLTGTKEHRTWVGIIRRCHSVNNPSYPNYGAKGIFVCDEWRNDFDKFLKHIGQCPDKNYQIDRIDNRKGYEPNNVRWVSVKKNVRNRTITRNLTAWGITKPMGEWCEEKNLPYDVVKQRLNKLKWTPERALSEAPFLGKNQTYSYTPTGDNK